MKSQTLKFVSLALLLGAFALPLNAAAVDDKATNDSDTEAVAKDCLECQQKLHDRRLTLDSEESVRQKVADLSDVKGSAGSQDSSKAHK